MTGATVTAINVDAQGLASGVTHVSYGEEFFPAGVGRVLASFTYENSRLLLLSKSAAFPTACRTTTAGGVTTSVITRARP